MFVPLHKKYFEFFAPIWPCVNEKKTNQKSKILKNHKISKINKFEKKNKQAFVCFMFSEKKGFRAYCKSDPDQCITARGYKSQSVIVIYRLPIP